MDEQLVDRLRTAVGDEHVVTDPDRLAGAGVDWTGRFRSEPGCLVRPGTVEEVAAAVSACAAADAPLTVQGGNTGLVGGSIPVDGGVVLATGRLDRLGDVDGESGTIVAGAGVTLAALQAHAAAAGWTFGVDLASRDSATVGGMVATDAGGARVVLHGSMRQQVVGLEVVLADGTIARPWFGGAGKDTAGYRLDQLVVGSEGTLAVVTAARLRLVRPVPDRQVLLLGVATAAALPAAVADVRAAVDEGGARLTACELVTADGLALVADEVGGRVPVRAPFALLVELGGPVDDDALVAVAEVAAPGGDAGEPAVVVAMDEADRRRLWALRERHTEVIGRLGVPVKLDVAVPVGRLGELVERTPGVVADAVPGARTILFGHAAEANCHVNVVLPAGTDGRGRMAETETAEAVEDAVLGLVEALGGTVSAEHGIGRAKVHHLGRTRDDASIEAMRAVKRALDPRGILNPGVVLPADP